MAKLAQTTDRASVYTLEANPRQRKMIGLPRLPDIYPNAETAKSVLEVVNDVLKFDGAQAKLNDDVTTNPEDREQWKEGTRLELRSKLSHARAQVLADRAALEETRTSLLTPRQVMGDDLRLDQEIRAAMASLSTSEQRSKNLSDMRVVEALARTPVHGTELGERARAIYADARSKEHADQLEFIDTRITAINDWGLATLGGIEELLK